MRGEITMNSVNSVNSNYWVVIVKDSSVRVVRIIK